MKGLGRNFKYWGLLLEREFLQMLLFVLVFSAFFSVMEGNPSVENYIGTAVVYSVMAFAMVPFRNGLASVTGFSQSVAMGSSRKNSFLAMGIVQHLVLAESLLILFIMLPLVRIMDIQMLEDINPETTLILSAAVTIAFLIQSLSNLTGIVCLRLGNTAGVIFYFVVFFGSALIIAATLMLSDETVELTEILQNPCLLMGAIVADILTIWLYYVFIKKENLRFA